MQIAWTDGHAPRVVPSCTVYVGDSDEVVSLVVGLELEVSELPSVIATMGRDAADWVRRTRDPFDNLQ
jgi:hypothetical protein